MGWNIAKQDKLLKVEIDGRFVAAVAPELRDGQPATAAADWYALGFLMFRLLTGVWYEPDTDVFELLAPFDPQWREVLGALLDPDPEKRRALPLDKPLSALVPPTPTRRHLWLCRGSPGCAPGAAASSSYQRDGRGSSFPSPAPGSDLDVPHSSSPSLKCVECARHWVIPHLFGFSL